MDNLAKLTREKHLNHLTRVVPFLGFVYGIQSYLLMRMSQTQQTGWLVLALGICLAITVLLLVSYDIYTEIHFSAEGFFVKTPWRKKPLIVSQAFILKIEVIGKDDEFQTVQVYLRNKKKMEFYFVDNGQEFKDALTHKAHPYSQAKAA
jgi:hypothetical protein